MVRTGEAPLIVSCPKCSTRFSLADDKVKPGGVRIRCSKCQEIFPVQPPEPEAPKKAAQPPAAGVVSKRGGSAPSPSVPAAEASLGDASDPPEKDEEDAQPTPGLSALKSTMQISTDDLGLDDAPSDAGLDLTDAAAPSAGSLGLDDGVPGGGSEGTDGFDLGLPSAPSGMDTGGLLGDLGGGGDSLLGMPDASEAFGLDATASGGVQAISDGPAPPLSGDGGLGGLAPPGDAGLAGLGPSDDGGLGGLAPPDDGGLGGLAPPDDGGLLGLSDDGGLGGLGGEPSMGGLAAQGDGGGIGGGPEIGGLSPTGDGGLPGIALGGDEPAPPPPPAAGVSRSRTPLPARSAAGLGRAGTELAGEAVPAKSGLGMLLFSVLLVFDLFCAFVLWRNDWRADLRQTGGMLHRAIGSGEAVVLGAATQAGPRVEIRGVEARRYPNDQGDTLLVLDGQAENVGDAAVRDVVISGRLIDTESGEVAARAQVPAVGALGSEQLRSIRSTKDIERTCRGLAKERGEGSVAPGAAVGFTLVFVSLPADFGSRMQSYRYEAKVASAKLAGEAAP